MTLRLELSPQQEARLRRAATRCGIGPAEFLLQLLDTADSAAETDLAARGIGPEQAADLRGRLSAFAGDWSRPDMDVYDAL